MTIPRSQATLEYPYNHDNLWGAQVSSCPKTQAKKHVGFSETAPRADRGIDKQQEWAHSRPPSSQ